MRTAVVSMIAPALLVLCPSTALALPETTFGFSDLSGRFFDDGGPSLEILASDDSSLGSSGDVTSFQTGSPETVTFGAGFAGLISEADVQIAMQLVNITATSADASGTFIITDDDGDTLEGAFTGTWVNTGGFGFFNGLVSDAGFDTTDGDTIFEAPGTNEEPNNQFAAPSTTLSGAFSILMDLPAWFDETDRFDDAVAHADAILVPAPGSIVGLGLLGICAARRRR